MQDKELYQQILGLTSPWTVSEVKLDMPSQEIRVRVEHPRGTMFCCPECKKQLSCYDHGEERQWRHLDSCQFKTILIGRVPRVECPEHGVKSVAVGGDRGRERAVRAEGEGQPLLLGDRAEVADDLMQDLPG